MFQGNNQYNQAYVANSAPQYAEPIQWGGTTCWPRGFTVFCVAIFCLVCQFIGHTSSIVEHFHFKADDFRDISSPLEAGHTYVTDIGAWVNARTVVEFPGTNLTAFDGANWGEFDDTLKLPFMQKYCKHTTKATRAFFCLTTIFTLILLGAAIGNFMDKVSFKPVSILTAITLIFNVVAIALAFSIYFTRECTNFTKPTARASLGLSPIFWCISAAALLIANVLAAVLLPRQPADGEVNARPDKAGPYRNPTTTL